LNKWRVRKNWRREKGREKTGEGKGRRKNKAPATVLNKNEFPVQILNGKY
jgi:hypothetical protein